MKRAKKLLSVILSFMVVLSLTAVPASAASSNEQTENSVARVGDAYYDTLQDAFNAIDTEGTVKLVSNVSVDVVAHVNNGESITLDLGNYTLTASEKCSSGKILKNRGTLTIVSDSEGSIDASNKSNDYLAIENRGTLNVRSGKIIGNNFSIDACEGTVNISGGEVISKAKYTNESCAIRAAADTTINISGDAKVSSDNTPAIQLYGSELTISENATISGPFGVTLFNSSGENIETATHSKLTMTGGNIEATEGFAISGNNIKSALCSAEITGGSLTNTAEETCIYWPMEGELTIGGNTIIEGATALEIKMGTLNITDNAQLIGNGTSDENEPYYGGSRANGSALLVSTQMYGENEGQYIKSPELKVNITGGSFNSAQGNAITVYNTEDTDKQTAEFTMTGGVLSAEDGKAGIKTIMDKGNNTTELVRVNDSNVFKTSKGTTTVSVSQDAALAAVDENGETSYYANVNEALKANSSDVSAPVKIYVLGNSEVDTESLSNKNVTLTTAKDVILQISSDVEGMIVKETTNDDGSKTYELVQNTEFAAPEVTITSDSTTIHEGKTATLTANASHEDNNVSYTYEWYRDGSLLVEEINDTLQVKDGGSYSVIVTATKTENNVTLTSEAVESEAITLVAESHSFGEWKITKEPTATEIGIHEKTCSVCGYTITEEIPAIGTVDNDKPQTDSSQTESAKPETPHVDGASATGDDSNIAIPLTAAMITLAAMIALAITRKNHG